MRYGQTLDAATVKDVETVSDNGWKVHVQSLLYTALETTNASKKRIQVVSAMKLWPKRLDKALMGSALKGKVDSQVNFE